MHRRRARRLRRVVVIVLLLLLLLLRILSLKLLRIVALLLHRHWRIASWYPRGIDSPSGGIVLSLRRLTSRRTVIARIAVAVEEKSSQANEAKSCYASNCASRNGTYRSTAFAAVGTGSGCG